jgi:hypothetical protein
MGSPKDGGYKKINTIDKRTQSLLQQLFEEGGPLRKQAAAGFSQFLPGGTGQQSIIDSATKRFQNQTLPGITTGFGASESKGSGALNRALAQGNIDFQTDLEALLQQNSLQAAQGAGQLGLGAAAQIAGTPTTGYLQRPTPFGQSAILGALGAGGTAAGGYLGRR